MESKTIFQTTTGNLLSPNCFRVSLKDKSKLIGFFAIMEDFTELEKNNKWRFVEFDKIESFRNAPKKEDTTVLSGHEIDSIEKT